MSSRGLKIGDVVVLPRGHKVGMGRLREAVDTVVVHIGEDSRGKPIYGLSFTTKGRLRHTWISEGELDE